MSDSFPSQPISEEPDFDIPQPEPEQPATPPARASRRRRAPGGFRAFRSMQTIVSVAAVVATLFTLFTPANLFSNQLLSQMAQSLSSNSAQGTQYPTITPFPRTRIGIVVGHLGYDSGAVCDDGLTEQEINLKIAELVSQSLTAVGYEVDLLNEFDDRLQGYQGLALVSIHNDTCQYLGDDFTGFKVAAAMGMKEPAKAERLTGCLIDRYVTNTGLTFHANTISVDMQEYHAFSEISENTPAVIIETGFMNLDREFLTQHTDLVAKGISDGILCYIRNESFSSTVLQTPTP